jgi:hypothetical protein
MADVFYLENLKGLCENDPIVAHPKAEQSGTDQHLDIALACKGIGFDTLFDPGRDDRRLAIQKLVGGGAVRDRFHTHNMTYSNISVNGNIAISNILREAGKRSTACSNHARP